MGFEGILKALHIETDEEQVPEGQRRCSRCKQTKPEQDFVWEHKASGRRDHRCRECRRQYRREFAAMPKVPVMCKRCRKCGETKAAKDFSKYNGRRDGLVPGLFEGILKRAGCAPQACWPGRAGA